MPWPLTDFRLALLHWAGGSIFSVQQEFAAFILIEIGKRGTWTHASITLHSKIDSRTSGVDVAYTWSASIGYVSFTWFLICVVVFVLPTHSNFSCNIQLCSSITWWHFGLGRACLVVVRAFLVCWSNHWCWQFRCCQNPLMGLRSTKTSLLSSLCQV